MKTYYFAAAISALFSIEAAASSTVVCGDCQPASSTDEIVTRSPLPTTSCTAPVITAVPNALESVTTKTRSAGPTSSVVPVTAGGNKMACGLGGAVALAAAAVYLV